MNRTPTTNEQALLDALRDAWDLLNVSAVRFKICDGGRGNLGNTYLYQAAKTKARDAINLVTVDETEANRIKRWSK